MLAACAPGSRETVAHEPAAPGPAPAAAAARGPAPGDLLVLDADSGAAGPDGERRGQIFRVPHARGSAGAGDATGTIGPPGAGGTPAAAAPAAAWERPAVWAEDERWLEPVDLLAVPGGWLVLEQRWEGGAIFLVRDDGQGDARVELWWRDERTRQPVALARLPDGTLLVSDRAADPLGLGRATGCVFAIAPAPDGATRLFAAGPELVTPGALLAASDGRVLLMDADANPGDVVAPDGRRATPGVLFELRETAPSNAEPAFPGDGDALRRLVPLLAPRDTVSPIALIERRPGELLLVDANYGTGGLGADGRGGVGPGLLGRGAILRVGPEALSLRVDARAAAGPRLLVDPVGGDVLEDGRLVLADANADPLGSGADGTGKGVHGTGPGAVLLVDVDAPRVEALVADERFVTPLAVRRVRP